MKGLLVLGLICVCAGFATCKPEQVKKIEIVYFDPKEFNNTDTLVIENRDTLLRLKELFDKKTRTDVKFPRRFKITLFGKSDTDIFVSNGKYVRSERRIYELPDGDNLNFLDSILHRR